MELATGSTGVCMCVNMCKFVSRYELRDTSCNSLDSGPIWDPLGVANL